MSAAKRTADYVAEILRQPDRAARRIALDRVQPHLRADVKLHVERYWPHRRALQRRGR